MSRLLMASALAVSLASLAGCYDPATAQRVLGDAGYSQIEVQREPVFAFARCDKHDLYETWFVAMGPAGRTVKGAVCRGLFRGSLVRVD